jgi:hypothetical protein
MKSRTYTGWAVQMIFINRPPILLNVLAFGTEPPAQCAVIRHGAFETKAKAQTAIAGLPQGGQRQYKAVKVKIKFEVIE